MFAEISLACVLITLFLTNPLPPHMTSEESKEVAVTILLEGENARHYIKLVRSEDMTEVFEQEGFLALDAVVKPGADGHVVVHHTAFVRIEGEPLQVLSLEAAIDEGRITRDSHASDQNDRHPQSLFLQLIDGDAIVFKQSNVVGGFPDAGRYH